MVKKKKSKSLKLADSRIPPQTSQPPNPYAPTPGPQPSYPLPNDNSLAPNRRAPNDRPVKTDGTYPVANTPFPSAAGAQAGGPNGNADSVFSSGQSNESENTAFKTGAKASFVSIGNTGTQIFGGYFSEEYLHELRGRQGARKWDEMRRSEAQISMLMNAVMNPIKAANWDIEGVDESNPEYVKHKELAKACIFDMIDFNTFKHEALTLIPFGFSLLEVVHSVEFNHPKFGTFNGLKALSFRSQKTIENWQLEPKTGRLIGVNQYTYSDLGGNQFIPGEFLLVLTHAKEGDNYEGISALRPMLGAYKRKELYLKLAAIGIERYAIGVPVGTVPKGKEKSAEYENFLTTLQNYTSHEASYITLPEGWKIEITKSEFDASKIKELLLFENTEFANAMVANFLALGMNGGGGAYALGSNLGEFFTTGIQAYADLICDAVNRTLIPNLIKLNFGDQRAYPKMKCTGISDKAGKEMAETIKFLTDSRVLDPDMPLKEWLRKQYKMPKPDLDSAIALPAIPAGATANYPKPNDPVINPKTGKIEPFDPSQLAPTSAQSNPGAAQLQAGSQKFSEAMRLADPKFVVRFDRNKAKLKNIMHEQLPILYTGLTAALRRKYEQSRGASKILAAKGLETAGLPAYKALLASALTDVANQAVASTKSKVLGAKKRVALADAYDPLDPKVRALINAQANLIAETQASDLEKQVFFTFTASATTSDDIDSIMHDVDEKVMGDFEDGETESPAGMNTDAAAGDAVGHVTTQAELSSYFDPEVLDGIESFTFTNEDPVSEICQELAGTTFAVSDPDLDTYTPPLHHNCKSRLVPNLKGDSDNPDIDRGGLSLSKKALSSITLGEARCRHSTKK